VTSSDVISSYFTLICLSICCLKIINKMLPKKRSAPSVLDLLQKQKKSSNPGCRNGRSIIALIKQRIDRMTT
jgi:hypothetical protein